MVNLNIKYNGIDIKQYNSVTYLGCSLDETLAGDTMALKVFKKVSDRLKFLYRKNEYLSQPLKRLLCNALLQPHFDYACSAWYPFLTKKYKKRLQALQNKCIRFCLQLDSRKHIGIEEFERINWLPVDIRFKQCISSAAFKFVNGQSPKYMGEVFKKSTASNLGTRSSLLKLQQPLRNTNYGQSNMSYLATSIWNRLPNTLKMTQTINTYKHKLKKHFFDKMKNQDNDVYIYY